MKFISRGFMSNEIVPKNIGITDNVNHALPPHAVLRKVSRTSGESFQIPKSSETSSDGLPEVMKAARPFGMTIFCSAAFCLFSIPDVCFKYWPDNIVFTA